MATSTDPERHHDEEATLLDKAYLPTYLEKLPYRSEVTQLSPALWRSQGPAWQLQFTERLRYKLRAYEQLNDDQTVWVDLERLYEELNKDQTDLAELERRSRCSRATDPGLCVAPVSLEYMP